MPDLTLMSLMREFSTEDTARAYFERLRWPGGEAICPHCGVAGESTRLEGEAHRPGLWKCNACKAQFSVTVGTVLEDSKIPISKWLLAFYRMASSKTQVSALQLQRELEIGSYRSAWFMCQRIRYALATDPGGGPPDKLEGTVEADETYIGGKARGKGRGYVKNKTPVVSLVERGGRVRSLVIRGDLDSGRMSGILLRHVSLSAHLNTDESALYTERGRSFASHRTVNHSREEYARTDETGRRVTTNTAEGFFGNAKRSLDGTHHHVSGKYLGLYMAELDHKYNTRDRSDGERTDDAIRQIAWKRLMLRAPRAA